MDIEHPETYPGCEGLSVKSTAEFPLPQPPENPISRLVGKGHHEQTGNCSLNVDFNETYTRTGD
jgi:serine/threonine-protein kinase